MTFTHFRPTATLQTPAVNIFENEHEVLLEIELPGYRREDIAVEQAGRALKITAKELEAGREGYSVSYRERSRRGFERSFRLGADLDATKIQARYENGLLLLSVPRLAKQGSTKVEVQ